MSQDLTIRIATRQDAKALTELSVSTFVDTFAQDNDPDDMAKYIAEEMNEAKLTAELNDPENVFFLAAYRDQIIGYAKVRATSILDELKSNKPIEIERIYVSKQYHGKKAGAALMQRCIDHAINSGHDVIWLGVWEHNYKAVNFYTRWGFTLFGSHAFILGNDHQTDVLMKKTLP